MAICELAERYNAKFFTSSTLRYTPRNQELRAEAEGKIKGADCFSPHNQEPTHPEYGFYGIHGIETLYTVMGGKGCVAVSRMATHKDHVVVGEWEDGRIGTFRAFLDGTQLYGGTVYTDRNKALAAGGYIGYKDLLKEILQFFSTGVEPISREESLGLFKKGLVFVCGRQTENNSYAPKPADVVSVRGRGRFIYLGTTGLSKKGKLNAEIDLYV